MPRTVLVVDDSTSMRQMVTFTMKEAGFDVIEGSNGQEAISRVQGKSVNLVITDLNMPVMDGMTMIRQLRAKPEFKFTPILMLTTEVAAGKEDGREGRRGDRMDRQAVQPRTIAASCCQGGPLTEGTCHADRPEAFSYGFLRRGCRASGGHGGIATRPGANARGRRAAQSHLPCGPFRQGCQRHVRIYRYRRLHAQPGEPVGPHARPGDHAHAGTDRTAAEIGGRPGRFGSCSKGRRSAADRSGTIGCESG